MTLIRGAVQVRLSKRATNSPDPETTHHQCSRSARSFYGDRTAETQALSKRRSREFRLVWSAEVSSRVSDTPANSQRAPQGAQAECCVIFAWRRRQGAVPSPRSGSVGCRIGVTCSDAGNSASSQTSSTVARHRPRKCFGAEAPSARRHEDHRAAPDHCSHTAGSPAKGPPDRRIAPAAPSQKAAPEACAAFGLKRAHPRVGDEMLSPPPAGEPLAKGINWDCVPRINGESRRSPGTRPRDLRRTGLVSAFAGAVHAARRGGRG